MKIIGITGGVGAGKTQILEYLSDKYGASVCQTDKVAKKLQKKGGICYDPIVEHFGTEILDEKGELDRKKLSDIVFGDPKELNVLNGRKTSGRVESKCGTGAHRFKWAHSNHKKIPKRSNYNETVDPVGFYLPGSKRISGKAC